jgi:sodium/hydrogen exchanger-like protein 6/7
VFSDWSTKDHVFDWSIRTLSKFHGEDIHVGSVFSGIGIFLLTFSGSMALGVVFGLAMSLVLKHSHLSSYHQIESCLVALSAYTCYFFSNGIQLSGIVSLLFCGITLKHYAYHTMSRRTQRTTKSIFGTLAQLSENFIFIYLGLSLFTSPPASERVGSYFKPLFIIITAVAVVFTRYAAVFPLSEAINFVLKHGRGQRTEELPHAYQMMLFWAGLRGAVGVALAAGFRGENAQILRTTVLVVVVLTVVVFGGTTARMLEVLGIRTGVEDEPGSDSEDDMPPVWARRRGPSAGGWAYADEDGVPSPNPRGKLGFHYGAPVAGASHYNHAAQPPHAHLGPPSQANGHGQTATIFSSASSEYDSDGEVLPMAPTEFDGRRTSESAERGQLGGAGSVPPSATGPLPSPGGAAPGGRAVLGEDGQWFQQLDERYLLPLFSNATASRTWNARQAQRRSAHASAGASGLGRGGGGTNGSRSRLASASGSAYGGSVAASPEGSDEEDEGEIDLTHVSAGRSGTTPASAASAQGFRPNLLRSQSQSHEESRAERGLRSPVFRSGSGAGGSNVG